MHAIIFDIDGTLLDSAAVDDALYREAVCKVLGDVRFRESLSDYDYVTDSGILAQLFADNRLVEDASLVTAIKSEFVDMLAAHVAHNGPFPEIPGAQRLLGELSASDLHHIAIATGGWRITARLKLESAGLGGFDVPLATSDDAHERTDIMQIALSRLGTDFDSITYYGDGPWDVEAADRLGWNFVPVGPALGGLTSYDVDKVLQR